MNGYRLIALSLAVVVLAAADAPRPPLHRGINITNWFRFPPSRDPNALRAYLSDADIQALTSVGFDFVRLPVQPELAGSAALADAIARLLRQHLAVVVAPFATDWQLETSPADRARLMGTWQALARMLKRFDPRMIYPEVLNEPVFPHAATQWAALQHRILLTIRPILPRNTIVLTGADWGGVDGLLSLTPETDRNVVYSFHFYEPAELTALGAYRSGLDQGAMAQLPFPVADAAPCEAIADSVRDAPTASLMRFYCGQRWDAAKVTGRISSAGEWARQHNVRVIAGEFGASQRLNLSARIAWLNAVRIACEQQGLAWTLWGYDDSMGFSVHPPSNGRGMDAETSRALGLGGPITTK